MMIGRFKRKRATGSEKQLSQLDYMKSLRLLLVLITFLSSANRNRLVAQVDLILSGTEGSHDMIATFSGTGWTTGDNTKVSFIIGIANVINSNDPSLLGVSRRASFADSAIQGNPYNASLSGLATEGQYVPFETPISLTANVEPLSFKVIGIHFDDDFDQSLDHDDIALITDQSSVTAWPAGTQIGFANGSSSRLTLNTPISGVVNATFDEGFNPGTYPLDVDFSGRLIISTGFDFGDAPTSYGSTAVSNGARHVASGPMIGSKRDIESDGFPTANADGDDLDGSLDDEDGVFFSPQVGFVKNNGNNHVNLTVGNGPADYEIWVDWNRDGDFITGIP